MTRMRLSMLPEHLQKKILKEITLEETKKEKYKNTRVVLDGIRFQSKAEAQRYSELKVLEKVGEIKKLELQPKYELQAKFKKNGKLYRAITYIADFTYIDKAGNVVVEDVKGIITKEFALKRKLFEFKYPDLSLSVISRGGI